MTTSSTKLSAAEVSEYRAAFRMFDADGDGHINNDEMKNILSACGEEASDEEVAAIMKELDVDGGGSVEFDEFVFMMEKRAAGLSPEQELREAFRFFDRGNTGYITGRKLSDALKALDEGVRPDRVRTLMHAADFDADGRINFEDFARFFGLVQNREKREEEGK